MCTSLLNSTFINPCFPAISTSIFRDILSLTCPNKGPDTPASLPTQLFLSTPQCMASFHLLWLKTLRCILNPLSFPVYHNLSETPFSSTFKTYLEPDHCQSLSPSIQITTTAPNSPLYPLPAPLWLIRSTRVRVTLSDHANSLLRC